MSSDIGSREDAAQHLRAADSRWTAAVRTFYSYPARLRRLAEAAESQRKAYLYADISGIGWKPRRSTGEFHLGPELEPPQRVGAPALWKKFDVAVQSLGKALAGEELISIAQAFGKIGESATEIADALEDGSAGRATA